LPEVRRPEPTDFPNPCHNSDRDAHSRQTGSPRARCLLDDRLAGYRREPFRGLGIAGQTVGPYGTLLRLDIGKTIGRNAQSGFVANVVFLKLF